MQLLDTEDPMDIDSEATNSDPDDETSRTDPLAVFSVPLSRPRTRIDLGCFLSTENQVRYSRWWRFQRGHDTITYKYVEFPTALEYADWVRESGGNALVVKDYKCTHLRHPADKSRRRYCAVCGLHIMLSYMNRIDKIWEEEWGRGAMGQKKERSNIRAAWRYAKSQVANAEIYVEDMARKEKEWEVQNPDFDASFWSSFTRALMLMSDRGIAPPLDIPTDGHRGVSSDKRKQTKLVTFPPNSESAPESNPRTTSHFFRRHSRYSPGKYACPSSEGWQDHSRAYVTFRNLRQFKVYISPSREHAQDPSLDPTVHVYQGILDHWEHHRAFLEKAEQWRQDPDTRDSMKEVCESGDSIYMYLGEGYTSGTPSFDGCTIRFFNTPDS